MRLLLVCCCISAATAITISKMAPPPGWRPPSKMKTPHWVTGKGRHPNAIDSDDEDLNPGSGHGPGTYGSGHGPNDPDDAGSGHGAHEGSGYGVGMETDDEDLVAGSGHGHGDGDDEDLTVEGGTEMCEPCPVCECQSQDDCSSHTEQLNELQRSVSNLFGHQYRMMDRLDVMWTDLETCHDNLPCPEDFIYDERTKMCFQMVQQETTVTWEEAQRSCQHLGPGVRLAELDIPQKLDMVGEYFDQHLDIAPEKRGMGIHLGGMWNIALWVGGIENRDHSRWFWAHSGRQIERDSHKAPWLPWGPYEPTDEHACLVLSRMPWLKPEVWRLKDIACVRRMSLFICELAASDVTKDVDVRDQ